MKAREICEAGKEALRSGGCRAAWDAHAGTSCSVCGPTGKHDHVRIDLPTHQPVCNTASMQSHPSGSTGKYDQVRINFANPDMVGHTGDLEATRHCCELVDQCVKVSAGTTNQ